MKFTRCIIVSGSPEKNVSVLNNYLDILPTDLVIACDSGVTNAERLCVKPDIIVGDFDSYEGNINEIKESEFTLPKIIKLNSEKDDTDTLYAVKLGLEKGIKQYVLLEALGGRLDHTIANISTAVYLTENNASCRILSDKEDIYIVKNGKLTLSYEKGTVISVFSYSDISKGVFYKGLKYDLQDAELRNSFPLGISNVFIEKEAEIEIREGILIIIVNKTPQVQ